MTNKILIGYRTLAWAGAALAMLGITACDMAKQTDSATTDTDQNASATAMEAADEKSRVDAEMGGIKMHDEMTDKEHANAGMQKDQMGEDHMRMDKMDKMDKMPGATPGAPAKDPPMEMPMKDDM